MFLMAALTRSLASAVAQKDGKGPSTDVELRIPDDVCIGGLGGVASSRSTLSFGSGKHDHDMVCYVQPALLPLIPVSYYDDQGAVLPRHLACSESAANVRRPVERRK